MKIHAKSFLIVLAAVAGSIIGQSALSQNVQTNSSALQKSTVHEYKEQNGDLPNFHEVHPYLYRGGQPSREGLKELRARGVQTVIDLRNEDERVKVDEAAWARSLDMRVIYLPMTSRAPTRKQVRTLIETIEKAQKNGTGPIYVHCHHGSDRTGCMIGIWRVTHDGWNYDKAYEEMRKYYFNPKYTELSGTVKTYTSAAKHQNTASRP